MACAGKNDKAEGHRFYGQAMKPDFTMHKFLTSVSSDVKNDCKLIELKEMTPGNNISATLASLRGLDSFTAEQFHKDEGLKRSLLYLC